MTMTLDGTNGVTFNDTSLQGAAASPYVLKNRIINGDMRIDQRNAGASVTPVNAANTYTLDRWTFYVNQASKLTAQQSTTAPTGFTNSLKVTSSSAYSVVSGDIFVLSQAIEGLNISDLGWGTASAKTVTLSFQVYSSLTGTFGGVLQNSAQNRTYPFTYTISSANTWTTVSVTIPGDTSGTWLTTNGVGIYVFFGLGVGTTFSGTAGAWAGATYFSATGATSVVGTNAATWYVTGVQLEQNTSATPFERRLYNAELDNCQRYYWQRNSESSYSGVAAGGMNGASQARFVLSYPVPMRSAATVSITNIGNMIVNQGASDLAPSSLTAYANSTTAMIDIFTTTSGTLGRGATLIYNISSSSSIQASAEL
jgi:hypothetical protein